MSTSRLNGFYLTILAVNIGLKPGVSGNRSDLNNAELHSPGIADNVHRNFWVEALLELVPNIVFRNCPVCFRGGLFLCCRLRFIETERVQIFFRDTGQSVRRRDRVTATERLSDYALRSSCER